MSQTCSPSTQRRYGLARVCRVWELGRSTQRERRRGGGADTAVLSQARVRHVSPVPRDRRTRPSAAKPCRTPPRWRRRALGGDPR